MDSQHRACGSVSERTAIQDVLVALGGLSRETDYELKSRLEPIVVMLIRMVVNFDGVTLQDSLDQYSVRSSLVTQARSGTRASSRIACCVIKDRSAVGLRSSS